MVGSAVNNYFKTKYVYDKYKQIGSLQLVNEATIIFICVPTPYKDGFDI